MSDGIAVCIPSRGVVDTHFLNSVVCLFNHCNEKVVVDGLPLVQFDLLINIGSMVFINREALVHRAIEQGSKYILFLDDDMAFPPDAFASLYQRQLPIACVNYPRRSYPINFVARSLDVKEVLTIEESTGVEEVKFSGLGIALIETEVFKKIPNPWFPMDYVESEKSYQTDDVGFFNKAREYGYKCYVDHDASKLIAHCGNNNFHWRQRNA